MSKGLGALVFVAGVAGLTFWGARVHSGGGDGRRDYRGRRRPRRRGRVHPLEMRVSGRDITVTGIADSEADLAGDRRGQLDSAARSARGEHSKASRFCPSVEPYETALAKGSAGGLGQPPAMCRAKRREGRPCRGRSAGRRSAARRRCAGGVGRRGERRRRSAGAARPGQLRGDWRDAHASKARLCNPGGRRRRARMALAAPGAFETVVARRRGRPRAWSTSELDYDAVHRIHPRRHRARELRRRRLRRAALGHRCRPSARSRHYVCRAARSRRPRSPGLERCAGRSRDALDHRPRRRARRRTAQAHGWRSKPHGLTAVLGRCRSGPDVQRWRWPRPRTCRKTAPNGRTR